MNITSQERKVGNMKNEIVALVVDGYVSKELI